MILRRVARLRSAGLQPLAALCATVALFALHATAAAAAVSNQAPAVELKLDHYIRLVLEHNETIQAQMLDAEANRRRAKGEAAIFEPDFTMSAAREANKRQNTVEQQSALFGQPSVFDEQNNIYNAGIESLVPTGAKVRLGSTFSDLNNNLHPTFSSTNSTHQFQTFVGATLTQPLLKNAGPGITLASSRIAALESDIAFQEYRRQLMLTISQAEAAYWNLYFAQEQMRFFDESVAVAQSILTDNQERLKAGQASELDVLESQAGLALRRTKQNDARQNYLESVGQVQILYGLTPGDRSPLIRVVDHPAGAPVTVSYSNSFQQAFELNPDYLIQWTKVEQERVRYKAARNQILPELDFKAAYGYNGLGNTPADSFDNIDSADFPSWSVGVELQLPLSGNIKGRNIYNAAKLNLQGAILNLNAVQTRIGNLLNTSIQKASSWHDSIQSYQTVVQFNEDLLKTQLERLNVGRVEPRKVLDAEADLFDARQSLAQALVQYQRALLELQLAGGTVLQNRHLDMTREQLKQRTLSLLQHAPPTVDQFQPMWNPQATRSAD